MAGLTSTNEAVDTSETGIDISPAVTAATRPSVIMIDDELMTVSAGTSTLTVARAAYHTVAAAHNTAVAIYKVDRVVSRGSSALVYYYADDGALAVKSIYTPTAGTSLIFTPPAALTDNTTGVAGATLPAIRVDSLANLGADVRTCVASLNAQLNALATAVDASTV